MGQFDWLVDAMATMTFTAFDTETTGLDPRQCRVVELGGIRFDRFGIGARFNSLIDPSSPMPAEASRINGITDEMLRGQPTARDVLPDFLVFSQGTILVAHNAPFDISFVNEELARLGRAALSHRVIDTRILARDVFPGLPKYALQDLAARFGIEAKDAHRAEDDARVCMELFLVCVERLRERLGARVETHVPTRVPTQGAPSFTARSESATTSAGAAMNGIPANKRQDDDEPDLFGDDPDEITD